MSMTIEEAIKILQEKYDYCKSFYDLAAHPKEDYPGTLEYLQALQTAISALRPITREQVEKVFPGCDFCEIELDDYPYIVAHSDYSSSDTCYEPSFCPICGKPMTDKAVEMVMERLEKIKCEN